MLHQAGNDFGIIATADPQPMPVGQFQLDHTRRLRRRRGRFGNDLDGQKARVILLRLRRFAIPVQ